MLVAIVGASGKLGKCVKDKVSKKHNVAGIDKVDAKFISLSDLSVCPEVIIDTSAHQNSIKSVEYALKNGIPMVIACTGHSDVELAYIRDSSRFIPIFLAYNMAYGVQIFKEAAEFIGSRFDGDAALHEIHHKYKKDAPSGTAKEIESIFNSMGKPLQVTSARGGTVIGTHELSFYGDGESITLTHTAQSRDAFASGIEKAAEFIVTKQSGLYNMKDLVCHAPTNEL